MVILCCAALAPRPAAAQQGVVALRGTGLQLSFDSSSGGLLALRTSRDFLDGPPRRGTLWRLIFRDDAGRLDTLDNTAPSAGAPTFRRSENMVTITWSHAEAPRAAGPMRVDVVAKLTEKGAAAELTIDVAPAAHSSPPLARVDFPVINAIAGGPNDAVAQPRNNAGVLRPRPVDPMGGSYPSYGMPMQFMLVERDGDGLYLGAEDGRSWSKQFRLTPGSNFALGTEVENSGKAGASFHAPFPFVIAPYKGGWMAGAKRYRAWAVKQQWAANSPMRTRATPSRVEEVNLWVVDGLDTEVIPGLKDLGSPADVADRALEIQRITGARLGVHWYRWHEIGFDADYPNYFPTRPGFDVAAKRASAAGVLVMPYINGRLWDTTTANFAAARGSAVKNADGTLHVESYRTSGRPQAAMCPATSLWQNKLRETVHRMITEDGVGAVYIDQIAAAAAQPCWDPSHGHTLGGGSYWTAGYRSLLAGIRAGARDVDPNISLTTELAAEPYMDGVDAFLIQTPRSSEDIPLQTAVYAGYTIYFGAPEPLEHGDVAWALGVARDWTWGDVPGWMFPHHLLEPKNARKLAFLGTLAKVRTLAKDFLVRGELIALTPPGPGVPYAGGDWSGIGWGGHTTGGAKPFTLPVVQSALYRAADGRLGLVIANADSVPRRFAYDIDCTKWKCPATKVAATYRGSGVSPRLVVPKGEVLMPAFGAAVIEVYKDTDVNKPKAKAKSKKKKPR